MYLSLGKAARELGVSPATVRRWTASGFLPCVRTAGGHRRIDSNDVEELARAIGDSSHLEARRARERELETLVQASIDVASRLDQAELLAEYDAGGRRWATSGVFDLREFPATRRVLSDQIAMTVNADDRGADPAEVALMRRYGEKSVLMLPLVYGGESIGLLEACDRERSRRYSAQELRLCRALAGQAAVALHNARLFSAQSVAETGMELLCNRLRRLAGQMAGMDDWSGVSQPLPALCEAVRAAFAAHSCVIARRGRVLGAAVAPAPGAAAAHPDRRVPVAGDLRACIVSDPHNALEVTLVAGGPVAPGQTELLELVATIAAKLAGEQPPGAVRPPHPRRGGADRAARTAPPGSGA